MGICKTISIGGMAAKLWSVVFTLALLCLMPGVAQAQTTRYTNTTDSALNGISDTATPCATPLVRTFVVGTSYIVSDVNIGVLLAHTYRADMTMTLQSPGGTTVTIFNQTGGGADNFNVLLDSSAATSVTTHAVNDTATAATVVGAGAYPYSYANTFAPANTLNDFNGQNANGTWTLRICDSFNGDNGTFYQADLYLTQAPANFVDLSVNKTVSNAAPLQGSTITYTVTLNNSATATQNATGVVVRDLLPAGLSFVSATASAGTYNSGTGVWTVGAVPINTTRTLTITATVTGAAGTTITNVAEVTAQGQTDLDSTANNGVTTEDDYSARPITVTRLAGTPPIINCPVGSTLFDWGVNTWTAGSLNNTYNLAGVGNFNIAISSVTPFVAGSPAINGNLTGGTAGEVSLFQNLNNNTQTDTATTVITMPGGLPGVQFTIFDVDFLAGQYSDKVTVTGSYGGIPVVPVLTNNTANYVSGNVAIGDFTASDTTAAGNVVVTFNSPIDTITIVYGNHTTAPANPGNQWIGLSDIRFCNPYTNFTISKISQVLADGVSATNPKAIPGATVQYCITFGNTGGTAMTSVAASDPLPANMTFVAGSMRSGATCGTATTVEDDNNAGADENDPFGMSITGTTVSGTAATLAGGSTFAMTFNATVN